MKRLAAFVLLLAGIGSAYAGDGDAERLRAWRAGGKRSRKKRWRNTASTAVSPVRRSATHSSRACTANPTSRTAPSPAQLRYLRVLHRNLAGETLLGELVCNEAICGDLLDIFRVLLRHLLPHGTHGADRRIRRAGRPLRCGPTTLRHSTSGSSQEPGCSPATAGAWPSTSTRSTTPYVKTNGGRIRSSPPGTAPYAERKRDFPQDRRGLPPAAGGVPAPRIHLGRPLEKPEGLPAFREKAIAARKPQHCAGGRPRLFRDGNDRFGIAPGYSGTASGQFGTTKGSRPFEVGSLFSFGHRIFRRPDYFTPKSFPFSEKLSYSALSEAIRSRTDWIFSARHALAPQKA